MRLTFLGAARMVTGSSYLLEVGEDKILVDCGMFQGSKTITALNRRPFLYDPTALTAVLLTHAHIDHSGLLPKLCNQGFKGPIYATKVTSELCHIMLPDSAHIQEYDTEVTNRKGQRAGKIPIEPIYTIDDAYHSLKQFSPVPYNEELIISPHITVRFQDAGHILGSALLEIWVTENGTKTKLVFSGDLGQPNQPIIKDPSFVADADYIITESTYGNRKHDTYDKVEKLAEIINDTVTRGGNIIIPSFAVGRTQTLLYYLSQLLKAGQIPDIPVIIDSPLAISATDIFLNNTQDFDNEASRLLDIEHQHPLLLPKLKFTRSLEESKALNNLAEPAIIISASGMADAGRILHHLKHNLWRPETSVVFVGYQSQGSLGRRLLEGVKRVKIIGEEIKVRAQIHSLEGFSAHADQDQLLNWLAHFTAKPVNIFIVHGEYDMSIPFAKLINDKLNLSTYTPKYGDTAVIHYHTWQIRESDLITTEPAIKELYEHLELLEAEYRSYRKRLETIVITDSKKIPDILNKLNKIEKYIKKILTGI